MKRVNWHAFQKWLEKRDPEGSTIWRLMKVDPTQPSKIADTTRQIDDMHGGYLTVVDVENNGDIVVVPYQFIKDSEA